MLIFIAVTVKIGQKRFLENIGAHFFLYFSGSLILRDLMENLRMKKSPVPEIRMTEAALKRQAKIKQVR